MTSVDNTAAALPIFILYPFPFKPSATIHHDPDKPTIAPTKMSNTTICPCLTVKRCYCFIFTSVRISPLGRPTGEAIPKLLPQKTASVSSKSSPRDKRLYQRGERIGGARQNSPRLWAGIFDFYRTWIRLELMASFGSILVGNASHCHLVTLEYVNCMDPY